MMAQEVHHFKCPYIWSTSQPHFIEHLMEILVIGLNTNTIDQQGSFESTAGLKVLNVLVSSGRDGQIPMAVLHSSFSFRFGLNALFIRYILLHLPIANRCTIVVSVKHKMASFIQIEQCVNVANVYDSLVINNNRMNYKHGMLQSSP